VTDIPDRPSAICENAMNGNNNNSFLVSFNFIHIKDKSKVVCNNFPCFNAGGKPLQFVTEF